MTYGNAPIHIGSQLELMVDDYLIAQMHGGAELRLHHPIPREAVLTTDQPWEGNACGSYRIFRDNDLYRMYYKGRNFVLDSSGFDEAPRPQVVCYAESVDGINWDRPELGLVEFEGSKRNNIILDNSDFSIPCSAFAPFKDANPEAAADARYKAWGNGFPRLDGSPPRQGYGPEVPIGLYALKSADGIRWTRMSEEPVIEDGLLDSQNVAFWDAARGEYREYHRNEFRDDKTGEEPYAAHPVSGRPEESLRGSRYGRDLRTSTSSDFVHWSSPEFVNYTRGRVHEVYNNSIEPYFRAPHLFVGLPTRYVERPWSESMEDLPELDNRRLRAGVEERFGCALTDGMFMTSRDGHTFDLWPESFIRPGLRTHGHWAYGDGFTGWGMVTTKSSLTAAPDELSIYSSEGNWHGDSTILRRYTLRQDGFVSMQAPLSGGELITRPLIFSGNQLVLNFSASAAGSLRVEVLRDQMDIPIEGLTLNDCVEILGDDLNRAVRWNSDQDLGKLAGIPIRLRILLQDADLYSFHFQQGV